MRKRIICALLCVIIVSMMLTGCGKRGDIVLEYDGVDVAEREYIYWLSHYKSVFADMFPDMEDTDEFWDSVSPSGGTYEEYFTAVAIENMKKNIAASWLFDYMGLKFTSEMKKSVKDGIDDLKETLVHGDENEFEEYLDGIGITEDDLYRVYVTDAKINYAFEYLYGSEGVMNIPDSDKLIFLRDNYSHIQHLYINNKFRYLKDENGKYIADDETGKFYSELLTDDEVAEKNAMIEAVKNGLDGGESFEELYAEYSEDKLYADGYYLQTDTPFIEQVVDAAFDMKVGEVKMIETQYGVHFIKRYEIEGSPWDDSGSSDFFEDFNEKIADYVFTVMINEVSAKVTVNEDIVKKYRLRDITPNSYI